MKFSIYTKKYFITHARCFTFIYSFAYFKIFLTTFSVLGTVLVLGDSMMNKTNESALPSGS